MSDSNTTSTTRVLLGHRGDEQIVVDLNFHRAKHRRDCLTQSFPINNVPAFDGDDLAFGDVSRGEQTVAMDLVSRTSVLGER